MAGFVPGIGIIADVANAGVSAGRGNWVDAGINVIAAIPGLGDAIKGAKIAATSGTAAVAASKLSKVADAAPVKPAGELAVTPKDADFIVTPQGLAISSRTLARQGASNLAGNFQGLAGKSMAEIIERVPSNWKMVPQDRGVGIKFLDELGKERIRIHAPSPRAPAGSSSARGWVLRIMDRAGNYYDDAGRIVPYRGKEGHIPIFGNPNWP